MTESINILQVTLILMFAYYVTKLDNYSIMSDPEKITTQEEIEQRFETDRAFSLEEVSQSLGRLAWLSTRLSAEFTLTLFDLGVKQSKIPAIVAALNECQEDYYDFVRMGLGATRDTERDTHPLEEAMEDVVDELKDTIDIAKGKKIQDSHIFKGGNKNMMDYGEMSEEDILHRLTGLIKRIESEHRKDK